MKTAIDGKDFRRMLAHYPTGVCAITATVQGAPVGMTVGSFTSVSLDPPLVAFFPNRRSTSWVRIKEAGHFCVNILSEQQEDICRALATKKIDKFEGIAFQPSDAGLLLIKGAVAWIDCQLEAVHDAGDHFIAVGRVLSIDVASAAGPLLFHKGSYGRVAPLAISGI